MKWIMIIFVCMGVDCQQFQTESLFDTNEQCQEAAGEMKEYFMEVLPLSTGEIYCLEYHGPPPQPAGHPV